MFCKLSLIYSLMCRISIRVSYQCVWGVVHLRVRCAGELTELPVVPGTPTAVERSCNQQNSLREPRVADALYCLTFTLFQKSNRAHLRNLTEFLQSCIKFNRAHLHSQFETAVNALYCKP